MISAFQPSQTSGADRAQVACGHDVKHLQQIGRADLHRQIDRKLLVGRIAMERQVVHQLVLVDQESQGLCVVGVKTQTFRDGNGDPHADLQMIL